MVPVDREDIGADPHVLKDDPPLPTTVFKVLSKNCKLEYQVACEYVVEMIVNPVIYIPTQLLEKIVSFKKRLAQLREIQVVLL